MSESETLNDLTVWHFKAACDIIAKAIEERKWDQAIEKCDQGKEEATDLKIITWVNKFDVLKQDIINLKKKEENMDSTRKKVMVPRLEKKKEDLKMQDIEIIEKGLDAPEQEETIIDDLSLIKGVGSTTELKLKEAGIMSIHQLATMTPEGLAQVNGFGRGSSAHIISAAKEYLEQQNEPYKSIKTKTHLVTPMFDPKYKINRSSRTIPPQSIKTKTHPVTPMFDPKYKINRSSRTIPPPEKIDNIISDDGEPPEEDVLDVEESEELNKQPDDIVEAELVVQSRIWENEEIEEAEHSVEFLKDSDEDNLNSSTTQLEHQTKNERYVTSFPVQKENNTSKNKVINGFLDDTLEIPQNKASEIQYEQVMHEIKNDFSDERLNKNHTTIILQKTQDILQALHYFIIPKALSIFKNLERTVDCTAVKVIPGANDTELILITPIKICDLKGTLLISDNGFDYHSEDNPTLQEKSKAMLVRSVMKDFIAVQSMVFDSMVNDTKVFTFFRKYLKDGNISIEKGRNNQTLFFRSGLLQYKIIINPLVLCHSLPSSLEKSVSFPYQKDTNIHYIDYAGLSSLITFMEHKYQSLESHCEEGNAVKRYFQAKLNFINDLRTYSIPFLFLGLIFLLIVLLQGSFLINTFIGLGSAAICVYGVMIVYLYLRFTKTKTIISKEFSSPYRQGRVSIDDTELFMISKDLSTEQMDQFIYECFGKEANFAIMPKIEEEKYLQSITAQKQTHKVRKPASYSFMSKNTVRDDNDHSKYGSFLED
jgi:predicted flap endonuclease-1-like 5' DNA nuclease